MGKYLIRRYTDELKFWKELTENTVKILTSVSEKRQKERLAAGLEIGDKALGLAHLGICGGSTPAPLYKALGLDERVDWSKTDVYLTDERIVPRDDARSNSLMVRESLYAGENEKNLAYFHDFMTELPVEEMIEQYVDEFSLVPDEELDLVILGVGPDGHFASIYPGYLDKSRVADDEGETVILSQTDVFEVRERITLTAEIVEKSAQIIIVMKGKAKLSVLEEIETGRKTAEEFPVKYLLEGNSAEKVKIYYCE